MGSEMLIRDGDNFCFGCGRRGGGGGGGVSASAHQQAPREYCCTLYGLAEWKKWHQAEILMVISTSRSDAARGSRCLLNAPSPRPRCSWIGYEYERRVMRGD